MTVSTPYVRPFSDICMDDVAEVGGKSASLGEMYRELSGEGVVVPNGFAITAAGYRYVLDVAKAWGPLHEALDGLDADDMEDLSAWSPGERDRLWLRHTRRSARRDPRRLPGLAGGIRS